MMGPRVSAATLADRLAGMIGPRVSVARGVLDQHGQSESHYQALPPDIVVFPETTQEVAEIVKLCAGAGMPIVPFGAGTSPSPANSSTRNCAAPACSSRSIPAPTLPSAA